MANRRFAGHIFDMIFEPICRFAEMLRGLLRTGDALAFESAWDARPPGSLGWDALAIAWRRDSRGWEVALAEVDALLLGVLGRLDDIIASGGVVAKRIDVFRRAELERLQHATAAGLVALRFGTAGLQTVVEDRGAPMARRYFALLAAADRHAPNLWPLFRRHLNPGVHHAFRAVAVEAVRFYPEHNPTRLLTDLFESIRQEEYMRAFLSPRILESMFVLDDPGGLYFWKDLLVAGHTHPDPEWCEVTRALVMVRRMTGRVEPSTKYWHEMATEIGAALDNAELMYWRSAPELHPVSVI